MQSKKDIKSMIMKLWRFKVIKERTTVFSTLRNGSEVKKTHLVGSPSSKKHSSWQNPRHLPPQASTSDILTVLFSFMNE